MTTETKPPIESVSKVMYSRFTVTKAAAEGDRGVIEGIASTPSTDRGEDIVEPKGAQFTLPIPLLWQHDADQPIGQVTKAKVTKDGITVTAEVSLGILPEIDRAWTLIKAGLVRGLSIGFRPLEYSFIEDTRGIRFMAWEWLELSAVTIPMNQDANIQTIKHFDTERRSPTTGAKSEARRVVHLNKPDDPGRKSKDTAMPTIKEQITGFENKRAALVARMDELVELAATESRTFKDEEQEEYNTLDGETKQIDGHLTVLRKHEATIAVRAKPVVGHDGNGDAQATPAAPAKKAAPAIELKDGNLPPGIGFARYVMCMHQAKGNPQMAAQLAKARGYVESSPGVAAVLNAQAQGWDVKTAVAGGSTTDTTWASPLVQYTNLASEFISYLRPQTIFGQLAGLRRVPFMTKIPRQTAGASGYWVGEQQGKPLSKLAFDSITMPPTKMATIVVISDELARLSSPSAEALVRDDMAAALAQFQDQQAFSPGVAGVANTNPASLTYGLTAVTSASSGGTGTIANAYTDFKSAFSGFVSNNINTANLVWIMDPATALGLATLQTTIGTPAFPDLTISGGTFLGLRVIVSNNVVHSTSGGSVVILMSPSDIIVADDGGVTIDVSSEASLQMVDNPSASAASLVSMFQTNQIAIRAEQYINYAARRTGAVAYIDMAHYA